MTNRQLHLTIVFLASLLMATNTYASLNDIRQRIVELRTKIESLEHRFDCEFADAELAEADGLLTEIDQLRVKIRELGAGEQPHSDTTAQELDILTHRLNHLLLQHQIKIYPINLATLRSQQRRDETYQRELRTLIDPLVQAIGAIGDVDPSLRYQTGLDARAPLQELSARPFDELEELLEFVNEQIYLEETDAAINTWESVLGAIYWAMHLQVDETASWVPDLWTLPRQDRTLDSPNFHAFRRQATGRLRDIYMDANSSRNPQEAEEQARRRLFDLLRFHEHHGTIFDTRTALLERGGSLASPSSSFPLRQRIMDQQDPPLKAPLDIDSPYFRETIHISYEDLTRLILTLCARHHQDHVGNLGATQGTVEFTRHLYDHRPQEDGLHVSFDGRNMWMRNDYYVFPVSLKGESPTSIKMAEDNAQYSALAEELAKKQDGPNILQAFARSIWLFLGDEDVPDELLDNQDEVVDVVDEHYAACAYAKFVSEPARNWRTWLINLMLLDLIDAGIVTTWQQFFDLHPMQGGSWQNQIYEGGPIGSPNRVNEVEPREGKISALWLQAFWPFWGSVSVRESQPSAENSAQQRSWVQEQGRRYYMDRILELFHRRMYDLRPWHELTIHQESLPFILGISDLVGDYVLAHRSSQGLTALTAQSFLPRISFPIRFARGFASLNPFWSIRALFYSFRHFGNSALIQEHDRLADEWMRPMHEDLHSGKAPKSVEPQANVAQEETDLPAARNLVKKENKFKQKQKPSKRHSDDEVTSRASSSRINLLEYYSHPSLEARLRWAANDWERALADPARLQDVASYCEVFDCQREGLGKTKGISESTLERLNDLFNRSPR